MRTISDPHLTLDLQDFQGWSIKRALPIAGFGKLASNLETLENIITDASRKGKKSFEVSHTDYWRLYVVLLWPEPPLPRNHQLTL